MKAHFSAFAAICECRLTRNLLSTFADEFSETSRECLIGLNPAHLCELLEHLGSVPLFRIQI